MLNGSITWIFPSLNRDWDILSLRLRV